MKKSLFTLLLLGVFAFVQAQPKMPPLPQEAAEALKNHISTKVVPVLKEKQLTFDQQLSKDDLVFIQAKRVEAAKLRKDGQALHNKMHEAIVNGADRKTVFEQNKTQLDAQRDAVKALHTAIQPFMQANETSIKATMEALRPEYEKWIPEQKAILKEYLPADRFGRGPDSLRAPRHPGSHGLFGIQPFDGGPRGGNGFRNDGKGMRPDGPPPAGEQAPNDRRRGGKGKGAPEMGQRNGKPAEGLAPRLAMEFVLWDRSAPPADNFLPAPIGNRGQFGNAAVFPNPATNQATLNFELPDAAAKGSLRWTNRNGQLVKEVNLQNLVKGQNSLNIDTSDWPAGVYFYNLQAGDNRFSGRLVINRS